MKLIEFRQEVVRRLEQARQDELGNPIHSRHTDAYYFYYYVYLLNHPEANDDDQIDWEQVSLILDQAAAQEIDNIDNIDIDELALKNLRLKIIAELSLSLPEEYNDEDMQESLDRVYSYPNKLRFPGQTLLQLYQGLVRFYQEDNAALSDYEEQDIADSTTCLNFREKDLIYCILAADKYQASFQTNILVDTNALVEFISAANEDFNDEQVWHLHDNPKNKHFRQQFTTFLQSEESEQRFVVAESMDSSQSEPNLITILIRKITVEDSIDDLEITILDSSRPPVATLLTRGQDACRERVLWKLLGSTSCEFWPEFLYPQVASPLDNNLLVEAINSRVASDLNLPVLQLTDFDILNIRWKLDHALRGLPDFPYDSLYAPPVPNHALYLDIPLVADHSFYLDCIAAMAVCMGGAMLVAGILAQLPVIALSGLSIALAGALVYGLFSTTNQTPDSDVNDEQLAHEMR